MYTFSHHLLHTQCITNYALYVMGEKINLKIDWIFWFLTVSFLLRYCCCCYGCCCWLFMFKQEVCIVWELNKHQRYSYFKLYIYLYWNILKARIWSWHLYSYLYFSKGNQIKNRSFMKSDLFFFKIKWNFLMCFYDESFDTQLQSFRYINKYKRLHLLYNDRTNTIAILKLI